MVLLYQRRFFFFGENNKRNSLKYKDNYTRKAVKYSSYYLSFKKKKRIGDRIYLLSASDRTSSRRSDRLTSAVYIIYRDALSIRYGLADERCIRKKRRADAESDLIERRRQ